MSMRLLKAALVLLAWGAHATARADFTDVDADLDFSLKADCYPADAGGTQAVSVIYLGGLFPVDEANDPNNYVPLERANRTVLEKIATRLNIRIAVPLAPTREFGSLGTLHAWNNVSLSEMETRAKRACDGAPLADSRALIGFSSGAIRLANMLNTFGCEIFENFAELFVIGAQGVNGPQGGKCEGHVYESAPHVFPPQKINLPALLKKLRQPEVPAAKSDDP